MPELNNTLVKFVIGAVVLFSLIFLVTKEANVYDDSVDKQICKQAVRSNAMTKIKGQDATELFKKRKESSGVECPIMYKEITTSKEKAIKEQLAGYMYDSWDMMGEGKLELFEANEDETYCVLTHHIQFKDDAEQGQIKGFVNYLAKHNVPELKGNMSYLEYLECHNTHYNPDKMSRLKAERDVIDTSRDYGIMFVYAKQEHLHKVWSGMEGSIAGTVLGGIGAVLMVAPDPTSVTKWAGGALLIGTGTISGGALGYSAGSDESADWSACVVLFPYTEEYLSSFQCTYMPGVQGTRS